MATTAAEPSPLSKRIDEEYRIWKKNCPSLYDNLYTHALTWPSLTCQWMPDKTDDKSKDSVEYRLVIGTYTGAEEGKPTENNHLMIGHLRMPRQREGAEYPKMDEKGEFGGFGAGQAKFEIYQRINHQGEVNRARIMPQNPQLIATRGITSDVTVFDYTKYPLKPDENGCCNPTMTLKGHEREGYGISWNSQKAGLLATSSDDHSVCVWDVTCASKGNNQLDAMFKYNGHTDVVEDVAWHPRAAHLFASVGDDECIALWDYRQSDSPAHLKKNAHVGAVNCISWNPYAEYLFLTGGNDKEINLWDMRQFKGPLYSFKHHREEVFQVQWSPHSESVFASASNDRRVMLWDLAAIGRSQTDEERLDGPPELMFIHGGHTAKVVDVCWNPIDPWLLCSVDEYNLLHIWKPAAAIIGEIENSL